MKLASLILVLISIGYWYLRIATPDKQRVAKLEATTVVQFIIGLGEKAVDFATKPSPPKETSASINTSSYSSSHFFGGQPIPT